MQKVTFYTAKGDLLRCKMPPSVLFPVTGCGLEFFGVVGLGLLAIADIAGIADIAIIVSIASSPAISTIPAIHSI